MDGLPDNLPTDPDALVALLNQPTYQQLDRGKTPELSYKSNIYAEWVNRQIQEVNSTSKYTDFWSAQNWKKRTYQHQMRVRNPETLIIMRQTTGWKIPIDI